MTTPNIALLEATMAYIETHPEEWNQETWRCGSGMCFAGWAATLNGREWATKDANAEGAADIVVKPGEFPFAGPEMVYDADADVYRRTDRTVASVSVVAEHDLGLTEEQTDILFDGYNSRATLRTMVNALKEGRDIDYDMDVPAPEPEETR